MARNIIRMPHIRIGLSRKQEYFLLIILFRLIMDYSYSHVVGTTYAYMGFGNDPSAGKMVLSWIILLAGCKIVYKAYLNREKKISFEVVLLLFFMSFIPFTSMVGYGALEYSFIICNSVYWFIFLFLCVSLARDNPMKRTTGMKQFGIGESQLKVLAVLFAIVVLYVSGRYAHFRLNFNLLNVYEFRADAAANNLPLILTYLFAWSRTLNSILLANFIRRKNGLWALGCIAIQLLSFGYDGSKSTFFLLILAIGVNIFPRFEMDAMNKWALRGMTLIVALCALFFAVTGNYVPVSIIVRRVFYLPVRISKDYFAFFTSHQPDYFRQSFLRYFGFRSPYKLLIPYLIGDVYFNSATMSANNGLISDAVANLGYIGIVLYPFLYAFIFRLLDKSSRNLDPRIFITVGIYLALVMTNSFIFTILLTHGLIVAMIVLSFMKREELQAYRLGIIGRILT